MPNKHYEKYKDTIKKVARRNYRKRIVLLNEFLADKSCKHCGESETVCLKFYPHDSQIRKITKRVGLNDESRKRFGCAFSRQTLNLKRKILEANQSLSKSFSMIEVHPEFCFMKMNNGVPQPHSKKTWNGMQHRLSLLKANGIDLPSDLGSNSGSIAPDDIIDAAAVAWTAKRFSEALAIPFPKDSDVPQIWV